MATIEEVVDRIRRGLDRIPKEVRTTNRVNSEDRKRNGNTLIARGTGR